MNFHYRRNEEVATRLIGGETMLIPVSGKLADLRNIYVLNEVGVHIWHQLDGEQELSTIAEGIPEVFDITADQAAEDCALYVDELMGAGLVEKIS